MRKATFRTALAIFCVALMAGGMSSVKAQTGGQGKFQIFAPNTYSLGMYGDVPVDYSTGVPQINVPLLNFTDKDINLDISLSYHASGIKVDQEATWVGLGWALNAGGMITREIRGVADGYNYAGNFIDRTSIPDYNGSGSLDDYGAQVQYDLYSAATNQTDNGPDIFYYNFNGHSGKFFFDESVNAVFAKYEDFKVQFIHNTQDYTRPYFIITDDKGIRYEFKEYEITNSISGGNTYISAWYLSRISSPSGGEITIEYTTGGISTLFYQKRCYNQAYFAINTAVHVLPDQYVTPCFDHDTEISGIVPRKIKSSTGNYVELITSSSFRRDSDPTLAAVSNQLDLIALRTGEGELVKQYKLNYGYFETNDITYEKFPAAGSNDPRNFLNYRLKLESLQTVTPEGQLQNPYRFEYYGDNDPLTDDPYTLPYRLSPSQDHWGYYNNSYNRTIFPYNSRNRPFHKDDWYTQFIWSHDYLWQGDFTYEVLNGGNREPNEEAIKAATLNKITYPTGGYTRFEFEPHDLAGGSDFYAMAGGLRVHKIETQSGVGPAIVKTFEYDSYSGACAKCLSMENPYYTWYWHNYDPSINSPGNPKHMMAYGVPGDLAYNNAHILRADGSPQLLLGSGLSAYYPRVKELSSGNGYTIYTYSYEEDVTEGGSEAYDGVPVPGLLNSAFVTTSSGWLDPANYQSMNISTCTFPYPYFLNNDWRRGQLISKQVYSESNALLSEELMAYDTRAIKAVPGYKVVQVDERHYYYTRYYIVGGLIKPVSQVSKIYTDDGRFLQTRKELEYNALQHKQVTETRDYTSMGSSTNTKYYYPPEYGSIFSALKDKNILVPVDTRSYRNGKLVSGAQVQYDEKGLPSVVYRSETGGADIPFSEQSPFTFVPRFWNTYNQDATLKSQTGADGVTSIFLWSYKGQYPIAQIQNASYTDVKLALNDADETFLMQLKGKVQPTQDDISRLNAMRSNPVLKQAQVTTYTYKALVGMTSMTDPNGRNTYYEYDAFNRLTLIRDQDHNILKRICYNYAGQPEDCIANTSGIWQSTGVTRCQPCPANGAYTSSIEEHEERDTNPASETYNTYRWVSDGVSGNCTPQADWQNTATALRCQAGSCGYTGYQEQEQRDMNPCSGTYNQTRWVTGPYNPSLCTPSSTTPNWQNTGYAYCQTDMNGANTGYQMQEQRDMNTCSPTYGQNRYVSIYNETACPLPSGCNSGNCSGNDRKCINNVCEKGVWTVVSSIRINKSTWECTYRYCFSDGTTSTYSEVMRQFSVCVITCL